MTVPRSIRAVLAIALFGLLQLGLAASASAGLPKFKAFTEWSAPVNLGATVNTQYEESAPTISADGLSLYFNRNRNGADPDDPTDVDEDIYVSHRSRTNQPWGVPVSVEVLNEDDSHERNVALSRDGSLLFFSSNRTTGGLGGLDIYVSRRLNKHSCGPDEWSAPVNLGPVVNGTGDDIGPGYFADKRGPDLLYFTSARTGGPGLLDIHVSARGDDGPNGELTFGPPALVPELSSPSNDARPSIRADGLEVVFQSNRLPSAGLGDVWVSTRATLSEPWGVPVSAGSVINTASQDRQVSLSDDAETLYFASNRLGFGADDIWVTTRARAKE